MGETYERHGFYKYIYKMGFLPTLLTKFFCLILKLFLHLEAFKSKTTSDCLNHTVQPVKSCAALKFRKSQSPLFKHHSNC